MTHNEQSPRQHPASPNPPPQESPHASRPFPLPLAIATACVLILATLAALLVRLDPPTGLRSDPAALRHPGTLNRLLAETTNPPPQVDPEIFSSLEITNSPDRLTIHIPALQQPDDARIYQATLHQLQPGRSIPCGPGHARLDHITLAYGPPPQDLTQDQSARVPSQHFDDHLQPMPPDQVDQRLDRWQRTREYRGRFPNTRFAVRLEGIEDITVLGGQVLDARTGSSLCSGYAYGPRDAWIYLETSVELWHQTPLWVVIDIAHGPVATEEVTPEIGLQVPHAWGLLQLAAIRQGEQRGFSSTSDSSSEQISVRFNPNSNQPETTFLFLGAPHANPVPLTIDLCRADGSTLPGAGGSTSGLVKLLSARAEPDEVRLLRIKRYPHFRRIILQLPELPGLPERNRGLNNLFDVTIPYAWFRSTSDLRQFIEQATQLRWQGFPQVNPPPGFFPRAYTNATLHQITADCLTLFPGSIELRVDPERHLLQVRPPWWKRLLTQVRRWLHLPP